MKLERSEDGALLDTVEQVQSWEQHVIRRELPILG